MRFLILPLAILSTACASADANAPSSLPSAVTLAIGERTTVSGTGLTITFEAVVDDSRCPSDVQCIQAGDATVAVVLQGNGSTARHQLKVADVNQRRATHGNYQVEVRELIPHPLSTSPTNPSAYRLTLQVSER